MRTVSIGLVLFLVMTFTAPLLSFADELSLSLTTNGTYGLPGYFVPGTKLEVSVSIQNPGLPTVVDFYFGYLLPVPCGEPGDTVVFFTDPLSFASGVGSVANPATLRPIHHALYIQSAHVLLVFLDRARVRLAPVVPRGGEIRCAS